MTETASKWRTSEAVVPLRLIAEQAFSRTAGAPLIPGNKILLLKDAQENYPAWIKAIRSAEQTIHFESYIIHQDKTGYEFADLLMAKASQGVRVRLLYDWFGAIGAAHWTFWRRLRKAGVEVRCFNPPRPFGPLDWVSRDHRKTLAVDGRIAFVTGLCVGDYWVGNSKRGLEPWRDTGVAIEGPAVQEVEKAFARMWALAGAPIPSEDLHSERASPAPAGETALRIVASEPSLAGLYRLDQLVAAFARNTMWLTDAYFLGTPSYVQSMRAAALDGVDVRLLLPRTSDIPILRSLSRVRYRTLLEGGVRIFEWDGSMLHAKTGVVDGRWARVGSTNLNVSSWVGNYELDVVAEDETFAGQMEEMYLEDLSHATEIIISEGHRVKPIEKRRRVRRMQGSARGSAGRAATGVITIGSTVGEAFKRPRLLGPAEAPIMAIAAIGLVLTAVVALLKPRLVSIPLAVVSLWIAGALLTKAIQIRYVARKEAKSKARKRGKSINE